MTIDCTLQKFTITGFSGYSKPFGTKKPDGEAMSSREEMDDLALPFESQRPHIITENSVTSDVQVNSVFEFTSPGIMLTLGLPAYDGCQILVINNSGGNCFVVAATQQTVIMIDQTSQRMEAIDGKWVVVNTGEGGKGNVYNKFTDLPSPGKQGQNYFVLEDNLIYVYNIEKTRYETHFSDFASFPVTGIAGRVYIALNTGLLYSWESDKYAEHYANFGGFPATGLEDRNYFADDTGYIWRWMEKYGCYGIHFDSLDDFPETGIPDVIYVADDTGLMYYWDADSSVYVEREGGAGIEGGGNNSTVSDQDLMEVLGVDTVADAVEELIARINNQGSYTEYFGGLNIGMYLDLTSMNDGDSTISRNENYENLRLRIAGFDSFKNADNIKNHIVFEFKNIPITKQMRTANTNDGGYPKVSGDVVLKPYLEGGFLTGLLAALGLTGRVEHIMDTKRKITAGSNGAWTKTTFQSKIFPPAEKEVFGTNTYGDATTENELSQLPLYAAGTSKVKRYNGSASAWWEGSPYASNATNFCAVNSSGSASSTSASYGYGASPCLC